MLKENLVMLRTVHGFSQEEIAEKIGISRQAYSKWEKGSTVPDVKKCSLLADVYGVSVDSLIKTESLDNGKAVFPAPRGKNLWGTVTLNDHGQIVIPKAARDRFGLKPGQRMVLLSDDRKGFALVTQEKFEETLDAIKKYGLKEL